MAHIGSPFGSPVGSPLDGFIHPGSPVVTVFGPFSPNIGSPVSGGFNYGESFGSPIPFINALNIIRNPDLSASRLFATDDSTTSAIVIFSKPRTVGYPTF